MDQARAAAGEARVEAPVRRSAPAAPGVAARTEELIEGPIAAAAIKRQVRQAAAVVRVAGGAARAEAEPRRRSAVLEAITSRDAKPCVNCCLLANGAFAKS